MLPVTYDNLDSHVPTLMVPPRPMARPRVRSAAVIGMRAGWSPLLPMWGAISDRCLHYPRAKRSCLDEAARECDGVVARVQSAGAAPSTSRRELQVEASDDNEAEHEE